MTNIFGKAAIFFNTGGHGGDNFKFKAFFVSKNGEKICNETISPIFTVWRRITVDYSSMAVRDQIPHCHLTDPPPPQNEPHPHQKEHDEDHKIEKDSQFQHYKGVFDDCFIEITKGVNRGEGQYYLALDAQDGRPIPEQYLPAINPTLANDTVYLTGVDHLDAVCEIYNIKYGWTTLDYSHSDRIDRAFVAVGFIDDDLLNLNRRRIDNILYSYYEYPVKNTAAHELTHLIRQHTDNYNKYGLICPGDIEFVEGPICEGETGPMPAVPARRSYLHSDNIMEMRKRLFVFDTIW